ncbi:helix-turn-helix domain-containing protein [Kibdelosporangium persicum]|uniref:Transcriptional regulator n=1 Tax=Kibdelosporangium persicum TaxID=2698649 RepID=A0ABX2FGT7_9PSEU|nr:tetratricopeptide repeat protein [Kibdelosporangium persicum]NRN70594.1 Transcriptional regulator [Kibdelosporangium persicum]
MSEFGSELKRLREAAGLSLAALASAIPTSKGYLSKIENGKANVSRVIADACDKALQAKGQLAALAAKPAVPDGGSSRGSIGLPVGTRHFVGRVAELDRLSFMLSRQDAVGVCVVHGMAGVGKTTVAIAAARAAAADFPDGCLFFDFRGHTPGAPLLTPADSLRWVLGLLEVPGEKIPTDVNGMANLYQSLLHGRRILLVFDNVRTAQQVRQLLPAEPGCRVIITSRGRLPALDDAARIPLDVLSTEDSVDLFRSVAGHSVPIDDDQVPVIVKHCGMLPLAIRIIAARFVAGGWTTTGLAGRLADENTRLGSLDDGERSVASAFWVSYDMLPLDQRWFFGLLALLPTASAETSAVHAMAGLPPEQADLLLDRLHDANLLTRDERGFVELHDLMRTFAARYALPEISAEEQAAAAGRLVDHALAKVYAADELLEPYRFRPGVDLPAAREMPFGSVGAALSWLRRQWPALAQLTELASKYGWHRRCWQLAYILRSFFFRERLLEPWISTHKRALASAERNGDTDGVGMILNNLGMVYLELGDVSGAVECHDRAELCCRQAGDSRGATDAVSSRAWVSLSVGDYAAAERDLTSTLATYREAGRTRNVVIALRGLAFVLTATGRFDEALGHAHEARALAQLPREVLVTINCIAWIHYRAGRLDQAERQYQAALNLAELVDSDYELARAFLGMGNVAARRGEDDTAKTLWAHADDLGVMVNPIVLGEAQARLELT